MPWNSSISKGDSKGTGNECLCLPEYAGVLCPPPLLPPLPPYPGLHFIQAQPHPPSLHPTLQRLIESSALKNF